MVRERDLARTFHKYFGSIEQGVLRNQNNLAKYWILVLLECMLPQVERSKPSENLGDLCWPR